MAGHVVEAFLGHPIKTGCYFLGDDFGDILVAKASSDVASNCEVVHQALQGNRKTEVIQNGGMKLIGQTTYILG
jgi:hypothetical protein